MTPKAKFKIYAALGDASGKVFDINVPESVRLRELLEDFARQAGFYAQLFNETGELKRSFAVLVNGSSIYHQNGLDTTIQGGDEVAVFSFVTGG